MWESHWGGQREPGGLQTDCQVSFLYQNKTEKWVLMYLWYLYTDLFVCLVAGHMPGLVTPILSRRSTKRQSSFLIRVWQSIAHLKSSRNASRSMRFLVKDSHQYPLVYLSFSVRLWCPGHISPENESDELRILFCF